MGTVSARNKCFMPLWNLCQQTLHRQMSVITENSNLVLKKSSSNNIWENTDYLLLLQKEQQCIYQVVPWYPLGASELQFEN